VNTRGQGLAMSEGLRFALVCIVTAIVVLLVFYFLNTGTKNRARATGVAAAQRTAAPRGLQGWASAEGSTFTIVLPLA
jgi:hypothetical protein